MQDPRQRRAQWITRKGRLGDQDEDDFDLLYWERIPPEQRMAFVWQLSLEQWRMIDPDVEARSGLYRSLARVVRP
jgi:hypothetical protein